MTDIAAANEALRISIESIMRDPTVTDRPAFIAKSIAEYTAHVCGTDISTAPAPVAKALTPQERNALSDILQAITAHQAGVRAQSSDIVKAARRMAGAEVEVSKSTSPIVRAALAMRSAA